ncbi:MAG: hypothetical protein IJT62_03650 [Oscillospiraceae bacterium]|nr:hypothetical protein [Oscillospiraceae bacterium]
MKKLTILIDMDDTIEQLLQAWVRDANRLYGTNTAYEDMKSWDVSAAFPGLTREQVFSVPLRPGFWKTVEPIPGAPEAVKRLMDAGHEVYIVTATPHESVPEKMNDLLFRCFPFLSWHQVIITWHKQMIRGDVLIDDGVHNLEGGDYVKILMTAPHNESYDAAANGMIRVHGWTEIEEIISSLAEEEDGEAHS